MKLNDLVEWQGRTIACGSPKLVQYDAPVALTAIIRRWLTRQAD